MCKAIWKVRTYFLAGEEATGFLVVPFMTDFFPLDIKELLEHMMKFKKV